MEDLIVGLIGALVGVVFVTLVWLIIYCFYGKCIKKKKNTKTRTKDVDIEVGLDKRSGENDLDLTQGKELQQNRSRKVGPVTTDQQCDVQIEQSTSNSNFPYGINKIEQNKNTVFSIQQEDVFSNSRRLNFKISNYDSDKFAAAKLSEKSNRNSRSPVAEINTQLRPENRAKSLDRYLDMKNNHFVEDIYSEPSKRNSRSTSKGANSQENRSKSLDRNFDIQNVYTLKDDTTLDLHGCSLSCAMIFTEKFISDKENIYINSNFRRINRFIQIITGWGKHSEDGIPKIKPAVTNYVEQKGYSSTWVNKGMMRIDLRTDRLLRQQI